MTRPKLAPCPACGEAVSVYTYETGWRRAECDSCDYIAEPAGNLVHATLNHNRRAASVQAAAPGAHQETGR